MAHLGPARLVKIRRDHAHQLARTAEQRCELSRAHPRIEQDLLRGSGKHFTAQHIFANDPFATSHCLAESILSLVKISEQIHEGLLKSALSDDIEEARFRIQQLHVTPFGASNGDGRIQDLLQQ